MKLVFLLVLLYVLYRVLRGLWAPPKKSTPRTETGAVDEMVQDPFCKAYFPLRDSERRVIAGKEYFFCSKECADNYEKQLKTQGDG